MPSAKSALTSVHGWPAFPAGSTSRSDATISLLRSFMAVITHFVFASTPDAVKSADLESSGADGIVAGHCGLPFTQVIGGRLWHNAGAVGMPVNDGTSRV